MRSGVVGVCCAGDWMCVQLCTLCDDVRLAHVQVMLGLSFQEEKEEQTRRLVNWLGWGIRELGYTVNLSTTTTQGTK